VLWWIYKVSLYLISNGHCTSVSCSLESLENARLLEIISRVAVKDQDLLRELCLGLALLTISFLLFGCSVLSSSLSSLDLEDRQSKTPSC
jgi:hypothetical protein